MGPVIRRLVDVLRTRPDGATTSELAELAGMAHPKVLQVLRDAAGRWVERCGPKKQARPGGPAETTWKAIGPVDGEPGR